MVPIPRTETRSRCPVCLLVVYWCLFWYMFFIATLLVHFCFFLVSLSRFCLAFTRDWDVLFDLLLFLCLPECVGFPLPRFVICVYMCILGNCFLPTDYGTFRLFNEIPTIVKSTAWCCPFWSQLGGMARRYGGIRRNGPGCQWVLVLQQRG